MFAIDAAAIPARALGCACALLAFAAFAQDYPNKPIRFIVPQPPGGTSDIVARAFAQKLAENVHQQVVVDNRAGASGTIGTDLAAKSTPDGYTLVLAYTTHTTTPGIYGNCRTIQLPILRRSPYSPRRRCCSSCIRKFRLLRSRS